MLGFRQWLEDCGEDFARGNKGPFASSKSKWFANDEEIPKKLRNKSILEPIHPEELFGKRKMKGK